MATSASVSVQDCGRYLCLQLPLSAGLGHSAVDLCFIVPGLRPQFGNAAAAEVLRTGHLWPVLIFRPLKHVAHGAVNNWWGGFGPSGASSVLFPVPAWAVAAVELWSCVLAGRLNLSVVTVVPDALFPCLALKLYLSAHFSPAVLEPHLEEQKKKDIVIFIVFLNFFFLYELNNIYNISINISLFSSKNKNKTRSLKFLKQDKST